MRRTLPLLLAGLLLVSTLAVAAGAYIALTPEPVTVTTVTLRTGDELRYDVTTRPVEGDPFGVDAIAHLRVEGANRTRDAFGIERETESFLVQSVTRDHETGEESPVSAVRCHSLRGGLEAVAMEYLEGAYQMGFGMGFEWTLHGTVTLHREDNRRNVTVLRDHFQTLCPGRDVFPARAFTEGQVARLSELMNYAPYGPFANAYWANHTSEPAVATTFNGRPALAFTFPATMATQARDQTEPQVTVLGRMILTVAHGLPGIVRSETMPFPEYSAEAAAQNGSDRPRTTLSATVQELTGFIPGSGPELSPLEGARLPRVNPDAEFTPYDRVGFDDSALGLPFPFSEALQAIRADPNTRFQEWLERHPEAFLSSASYDRRARGENPQEETLGGWTITWEDGKDLLLVSAVKVAGVKTPAGPLLVPVQPVRVLTRDWPGGSFLGEDVKPTFPEALASSATVAGLLAAAGLPGDRVETLSFLHYLPDGESTVWFMASDLSPSGPRSDGDSTGVEHVLDLLVASYQHEASVTGEYERSGLLHPFPATGDGRWRERLATQSATSLLPPIGTGAAAGAAVLAGAALLALAVKFLLLPFYTRLQRDRLLDNPVRARLHEAARATPGITLQELTDLAAIGDGATRHHLAQLTRHKLLHEVREGGYVRYFAAGEMPPALARREAVLRAGSNRRVFELLQAEPHLSLREAGARLGMSAPSVHKCVRKLRDAGLLGETPDAALVQERARV